MTPPAGKSRNKRSSRSGQLTEDVRIKRGIGSDSGSGFYYSRACARSLGSGRKNGMKILTKDKRPLYTQIRSLNLAIYNLSFYGCHVV